MSSLPVGASPGASTLISFERSVWRLRVICKCCTNLVVGDCGRDHGGWALEARDQIGLQKCMTSGSPSAVWDNVLIAGRLAAVYENFPGTVLAGKDCAARAATITLEATFFAAVIASRTERDGEVAHESEENISGLHDAREERVTNVGARRGGLGRKQGAGGGERKAPSGRKFCFIYSEGAGTPEDPSERSRCCSSFVCSCRAATDAGFTFT